MILAIDPGNVESAYVLVEDDLSRVVEKGKVENFELVDIILRIKDEHSSLEHIAIEMIASYGMAVGKTVFETCVWIGRFAQLIRVEFGVEPEFIYRSEEKMCLCHSMKAKDSNIRQSLIDRFGEVGTKKNPGYFYGFKKDIWSAMAVAVTYHEKFLKEE